MMLCLHFLLCDVLFAYDSRALHASEMIIVTENRVLSPLQ